MGAGVIWAYIYDGTCNSYHSTDGIEAGWDLVIPLRHQFREALAIQVEGLGITGFSLISGRR